MNNYCIYRYNNCCERCILNTTRNSEYCSYHKRYKNDIYKIIDKPLININNIYDLYSKIQKDDNIYTKKHIFKSCLNISFSDKNIIKSYYSSSIFSEDYDIINNIYEYNKKIYDIINNNKKEINIIKRFIFNIYLKKTKIDDLCSNIEDPFSFDLIKNIPEYHLFKFKDIDGNIYGFRALELKYYLISNEPLNPYNKNVISINIINRLNLFIKINYLDINNIIKKYKYTTINQAFTKVSSVIEKIGFYNNVQWFLKLSNKDILSIINSYKVLTANIQNGNNYFNNIDVDNIKLDFCNEIIRLFEEGNNRFLLCCYFIKALALYSDDFYNNLPNWLIEIVNPVIFINRHDNIMLLIDIYNNI